MKWYLPSWNGDMRLEPHPKNPQKTVMHVYKPTLAEIKVVNSIGAACFDKGWLKQWDTFEPKTGLFSPSSWEFEIDASLEQIGPIAAGIMKPGPAVLTAIKFSDGQVSTCSGGPADLKDFVESVYRSPPALPPAQETTPPSTPSAPEPPVLAETKPAVPAKPEPVAAATVSRPTPCCPECIPGAIEPATEVLLAFLDEHEHLTWAKRRYIIVTGGMSGCRYRISHRHSTIAQEDKRICYDLDTRCVVHFHDWSVPPEEEVLAAKLILEHREPWLRNEATMFHVSSDQLIFKNPFGDMSDGIPDSNFTRYIGQVFRMLTS